MARIGIWEGADGFAAALGPLLPRDTMVGRHPAFFHEGVLDLLLISPGAGAWAGANIIRCRTALVPALALPLTRSLQAASAVSYGTSPKDTLTISSLEGAQICVALQREIVTLAGDRLERQEYVLPFPAGTDPARFLGLTGAALLLTGRAEMGV